MHEKYSGICEFSCHSVATVVHYSTAVFLLQQQQQQPFYGPLSGTTRVSQYQKKTFTHSRSS